MSQGNHILHWFRLKFPPDMELEAVTSVVRSWSTRSRHGWLSQSDPLVIEVERHSGESHWQLGVTRQDQFAVIQSLRHHIPAIHIESVERHLPELGYAVELRLRSNQRQTNTAVAAELSTELLLAMTAAKTDEAILLQWVVGPWLPRSPVATQSVKVADPGWPWRLLDSQPHRDSEATAALRAKHQEHVFGFVGRIAVKASTRQRQRQLVNRMVGALQLSRSPGVGFIRRSLPSWLVLGRVERHTQPWWQWSSHLNVSELSGVLALPITGPRVLGVSYVKARPLPASPRTLVPNSVMQTLETTRIGDQLRPVATSTYPSQDGTLVLRPKDALHHLHVLGPTGSGKSQLLANLALADITAGRATMVIEPKGDLVQEILDRVPAHRTRDIVVLDVADLEASIGLNPLASAAGKRRELVVDQLMSTFDGLWKDSWGPRTNDILHAGLATLAIHPGTSLASLPQLFTDDNYRRSLTATAVRQDPWGLASFWAWFEGLSPEQRAQVLAPVMNKLRSFLLRPSLRAILGQPQPRFDLRQVFTERKVLLVNLSAGSVGPEASALLGSMLIAQLWQLTAERSQIAVTKRHPVMVFIDEFQEYLHLPTSLADVLAQARGLGVGLALAHQHLGQLSSEMREAVLANARSRVVFGLPPKDAKAVADGHPELTAEDISGLGKYQIYASLLTDGSPQPYASAVTSQLPDRTGLSDSIRAHSRNTWGVKATDTDAVLRSHLISNPESFGDNGFGSKRRST